jgi:hypothetical protein
LKRQRALPKPSRRDRANPFDARHPARSNAQKKGQCSQPVALPFVTIGVGSMTLLRDTRDRRFAGTA